MGPTVEVTKAHNNATKINSNIVANCEFSPLPCANVRLIDNKTSQRFNVIANIVNTTTLIEK